MKHLLPEALQRNSMLWLGLDLCVLYGVLFFLR